MGTFLIAVLAMATMIGIGLLWGWLSNNSDPSSDSDIDNFYYGPDPTDDFND